MRTLLTFLLCAIALPGIASAAEVRVLQQPGTREVRVVIDTQGEPINAVEGELDLPGGAAEVLLGDSVVPLWAERPGTGSLRFSGVIPGGFVGDRGTILVARAARAGKAQVVVRDLKAYRNDGAGTLAAVLSVPLAADFPADAPALAAPDTALPEFSEVRIARDEAVFEGDWFVAFNARDAGSGVVRYEVAERAGNRPGLEGLTWREASSPERLEDQSRRSAVFVKAIDGAGNERVERLDPEAGMRADPFAIAGAAALALLALAALVVVRRVRR